MASMSRRSTVGGEGRGKARFRALVRKVIFNRKWLMDMAAAVEDTVVDTEQTLRHAILKAVLTRREDPNRVVPREVKAILSRPVEVRTDEEAELVYRLICQLSCFRRYPERVQRALARCVFFTHVDAKRTVVKQGHEGHAMYFLLSGDVLINMTRADRVTGEEVTDTVGVLSAGDIFGEVALLHAIPRTATVVTATYCEMLGLYKEDFQEVLQDTMAAEWARCQREVARFSYFDSWDELQIRECCILSRIRTFEAGETILGDGSGSFSSSYFVLSGTCSLVQTLNVEVWEAGGRQAHRLLDNPTMVPVRRAILDESGQQRDRTLSAVETTLVTARQVMEGLVEAARLEGGTARLQSTGGRPASNVAVQDAWNMAALLVEDAMTRHCETSWKLARAAVDVSLQRQDPFTTRQTAHQQGWEQARANVRRALGREDLLREGEVEAQELAGRSSAAAAEQLAQLVEAATAADSDDGRADRPQRRKSRAVSYAPDTFQKRSRGSRASFTKARSSRQSMTGAEQIWSAWWLATHAVQRVLSDFEEGLKNGDEDAMAEAETHWDAARAAVQVLLREEQEPILLPGHRIETHFMQVALFSALQSFGIGEMLTNRRVAAVTKVECMVLPRYWLEENTVGDTWERVRHFLARHVPDSQQVFRLWAEQRGWLAHRQSTAERLLERRRLSSGTSPHDVPYSLRLREALDPFKGGYERRYIIREAAPEDGGGRAPRDRRRTRGQSRSVAFGSP